MQRLHVESLHKSVVFANEINMFYMTENAISPYKHK